MIPESSLMKSDRAKKPENQEEQKAVFNPERMTT
jgi:hypothetical protein